MSTAVVTASQRGSSRKAALASMVLASIGLGACSSAEDDVYKAFKCGRVAMMAGESGAAAKAMNKIKDRIADLPEKYRSDQTQFMFKLSERFTDDLALFKLSPPGQMQELLDVFTSSTCQKLYK